MLIWQKSHHFVLEVYKLTSRFPKEEIYGLTSQLKRAALSVVANIVEGRGKATDKDFLRFLYIANGSLCECQCFFEVAQELYFINEEQFEYIENKRKEVGYLLFKLIKSIEAGAS